MVLVMKLTVTEEAKKRIARYLSPDKKIILDFDDGVGPFSAVGDCGLEAGYKLVFVNCDQKFPDFDSKIPSNIGTIYYKGYTKPQLDEEMELRFNQHYFTMPLVSPHGTLTENVEVLDFTGVQETNDFQLTHDC